MSVTENRSFFATSLISLACIAACGPGSVVTENSDTSSDTSSTSTEAGDGDGDGSGDGDGDGDGDGQPGDGDGDGVGDGDGDGDGVPLACDPFEQDCPEAQKCVPYRSGTNTWDANKCVSVLGDGAAGEACIYDGMEVSTDTCDETNFCFNTTDGSGTCYSFCAGTLENPTCAPGFACMVTNSETITLCLVECDPLLQDCGGGFGCYWGDTAFVCGKSYQDTPEGEPCGYINDCAPGNACVAIEAVDECLGASCCASWCDLNDPSCTIEGTQCVAFFEEGEVPQGFDHLGVCISPGP